MTTLLTIIISTTVSVAAALTVTEALTPWFDQVRTRRKLLGDLLNIGLAAGRILPDGPPSGLDPEALSALRAEEQRVSELLDGFTRDLLDHIGQPAGSYREPLQDLVVSAAVTMRLVVISPRPWPAKAKIIKEVAMQAVAFVGGSVLRPMRRARAIFALARVLEAVQRWADTDRQTGTATSAT